MNTRESIADSKREDRGIDWWVEYEVLRRKYELASEYGSVHL